MELSERYGYSVTQLYRNSELTIGQKVMKIGALNGLGYEAGLDAFEFIASRRDLLYFWKDIYYEVISGSKDPQRKFFYADLLKNIQELETKRTHGKLTMIASIYKPSPIDYAIKYTFFLGTATLALAQHFHWF